MKTYVIQYSIPGNDPVISTWTEKTKEMQAESADQAIEKFEKNRDGTWMVLDCWEI
jgi:hypothetical protein